MSTSSGLESQPHVALIPSAGMGHLTPFLRLAASLVNHHCRVTLVTTHPTVSLAESRFISSFLSAFPQVNEMQFHLLPLDPTLSNKSDDPFTLQWQVILRSVHLLSPLLTSIYPLSAVISDVTLGSSIIPITTNLGLLNYILFPASARMCSLFASFPNFVAPKISSGSVQIGDEIEIPGLHPIPISSIPPALLNSNSLFATIFLQSAQEVMKLNGVLINTFEALEGDILHALNDRKVLDGFPPLYAIGPLLPCEFEKRDRGALLKWLDDQPEGSVVYVGFGSRTALSREQINELGNGLVSSGCRFLWVVKDKKVDKDDDESLDNLLGHALMEKIMGRGLVSKNWVDQDEILSHKAVGGFVGHGGWNSLAEAAWNGVRLLVWPQSGDQKMNAETIERSGLGMWVKSWGWGEQVVVKGDEIAERIKEMMGDHLLKSQAVRIREEAMKAVGDGGSSVRTLKGLIQKWRTNT
ncbi:hypothetical protein LWI28_000359 [Acer negundo]|uniref:Glycosyltransferase n=1 Tax=Acer negundo TaxID=4023 RepID=A0AAD5IK16_ACENE|nr:hypothetical protein LWI28_000359 [Acer negundo]